MLKHETFSKTPDMRMLTLFTPCVTLLRYDRKKKAWGERLAGEEARKRAAVTVLEGKSELQLYERATQLYQTHSVH